MSTANLAQYGVSHGNIRQLFGEALVALGHANPDVVVLDCQTAMPTAAVAFAKAFPDRFIDHGDPARLLLAAVLLAGTSFCATSVWSLFGTAIRTYLHDPRWKITVNVMLCLLLVYTAFTLIVLK